MPYVRSSVPEASSFHLTIFETGYRVETDSPRVRQLLLDLWTPFLTDGDEGTFEVVITETADGWDAQIPGVPLLPVTDIWQIADALKHSLVEHALARATSVLAIHAAFLEKEDLRVLLVGPSGGGKTTLCLRLLEEGWRYGSDDLAPIVLGVGDIVPFPRALSVRDPETFERYVHLWQPSYRLEAPEGPFQLPATLFELMPPPARRATHTFFLERDEEPVARFTPLTMAASVVRLSQYVRWFGDVQVRPLVDVLRDSKAGVLTYATPDEGAEGVRHACSVA